MSVGKTAWRGCGSHVTQVMGSVPKNEWCACEPRTSIDGKDYPPQASLEVPGLSWVKSFFSGGQGQGGKGEGKGEL